MVQSIYMGKMRKDKVYAMMIIISIVTVTAVVAEFTYSDPTIPEIDSPETETFVYMEGWGEDIGDVAIGASGVYYNVTNMTTGEISGFTFDGENITALYSGVYSVDSAWSFSGGANTEYHISISINGFQEDHCHAERKIGTGGDVGSAGFTCLENLNAGDVLKVVIENVDNVADATIHDINVNMVRITG